MTCEEFQTMVKGFEQPSRGDRAALCNHISKCEQCLQFVEAKFEEGIKNLPQSQVIGMLVEAETDLCKDAQDAEWREVAWG